MDGTEVTVGGYTLLAGGADMSAERLEGIDLLVSLREESAIHWPSSRKTEREVYDIPDFQAPKIADWKKWLAGVIVPMLAQGTRIAVHCTAGIGRTGMFIASLIALCEPDIDDPIAEARKRYRPDAVETAAQMELVFALRGQALPEKYHKNRDYSNWKIGQ